MWQITKNALFRAFINNCDAPGIAKISEQKYYENINKLKEILVKEVV